MTRKFSRSSAKSDQQKKKGQTTAGMIRIIAGKWRGRRLPVHDIEGLRPTTDRVKETVFNWLMNDIDQTRCLDCFAGSGSLGFEVLSRGAASVTMIEKDHQAAKQLAENVTLLAPGNTDDIKAQIVKTDCLSYLSTQTIPYDLVFIDPPFRQNLAEPVCELLESRGLLTPSALIYVEVESELTDLAVPANWQLLKEKTAGQVSFRLYQNGW